MNLIERLSPMIPSSELREFEKKYGLGNFDVMFKQMEGEKTIWGKEEKTFNSCTLKELTNNIYDYLYDGYEMWVRETPLIADGPTKISDTWVRYVISSEANNLKEDDAVLICRMVSGWLVISAVYNATPKQRFRFYSSVGILDKITAGPTESDMLNAWDHEVTELTDKRVHQFSIKRNDRTAEPTATEHELIERLTENLRLRDSHRAGEQSLLPILQRYQALKNQLLDEKRHLSITSFKEMMGLTEDKITEIKKLLNEYLEHKKRLEELTTDIKNRKYYTCNVCESVFCDNMMVAKRVCFGCRDKMYNDIAKQKGYHFP